MFGKGQVHSFRVVNVFVAFTFYFPCIFMLQLCVDLPPGKIITLFYRRPF